MQKAERIKLSYIKNFGKNYLKVVITKEGNGVVVITNHWVAKNRIKK